MGEAGLRVVTPGVLMTVQDLGRPGMAHMGVTGSGAADVPAHSHANALVGNDPAAATLEVTAGGCEVQVLEDVLLAVTGARGPVWVGSVPAPFGSPMRLRAGQTLELGAPEQGLRSYIAVRGGVDVAPVLGSRATDVLSGLGPEPLRAGDVVPVGVTTPVGQAGFDQLRRLASTPAPTSPQDVGADTATSASAVVNVRVHLGPRDDWFTESALDALGTELYEVSSDSNRVGVRLTGPTLERTHHHELESEGLVTGAVQVPTSGQPVIFLADHPVTGGYPVIAVVEPDDLPLVAQARPGDRVRFTVLTPPGA